MDPAALALLGVVTGVLLWRATMRERRDYARFKRLRSTLARQRVYRRWVIESVLVLGGLSVAVLVAAWRDLDAALAAAQAWAPVAAVRDWLAGPVGVWVGAGIALAALALLVVPVLALRTTLDEMPAVGDIRALLPRTRGELPYGAVLGIQAGVLEELLFRLGLPALVFGLSGDPLVAFASALLVFGVLHVYQKWVGVLSALVIGIVLTAVYVVTGSIVAAIVVHAALDLRSLVLIPIVVGKAHRLRGPGIRPATTMTAKTRTVTNSEDD